MEVVMLEIIALVLLAQQPLQPVAEGVASYYTVSSSSQLTASGEQFRDDLMTCAMLDGEFGHYYLVVSDTGKSVVCKLNDRGPYIKNRVIDLSEAAMEALSLSRNDGLLNVRVFHLGTEPIRPPNLVP